MSYRLLRTVRMIQQALKLTSSSRRKFGITPAGRLLSSPVKARCWLVRATPPSSIPIMKYSTAVEASIDDSGELSDKEPLVEVTEPEGVRRIKYNCSGCGAQLQSASPKLRGFIPEEKMKEWFQLVSDPAKVLDEDGEGEAKIDDESEEGLGSLVKDETEDECSSDVEDYFPESFDERNIAMPAFKVSSFICQRCFSLKHYNDALNITLDKDDYLQHLSSLRDKKALVILMLDVADFPGCIFPNLKDLLSTENSVLIVANKIDLFPGDLTNSFWSRFRTHIIDMCKGMSLDDHKIVGVRFISVKSGAGVLELSEELVRKWGSRGDVYLLGCTNVGKSSLFNKLLLHLCGSKPGELNMDSNLLAPKATISKWPGTTLSVLSFPLMSFGKRRRLLEQQRRREDEIALGIKKFEDYYDDKDDFKNMAANKNEEVEQFERELLGMKDLSQVEVEDVLGELGLRRKKKQIVVEEQEPPQNRYWLHDTPGAINDTQLINHLTPKELTLGLPKAPLKPKTFILKPGQCLFLGGLARLDYLQGSVSAYFTVFTWSYLNVHTTKVENADQLYERHLGSRDSVFKLPVDAEERVSPFPPLGHQDISLSGAGWKKSAADVVLSSAGWVGVTFGGEEEVLLRAHAPNGKGIYVRQPALFDNAINQRGNRERKGNRTAFLGYVKKRGRS